jgi:hypothetical protein
MNTNKLNEKNISEAIIKVIAFFDLFDYPLTLSEIWQWTQWPYEGMNITQVIKILERKKNKIQQKQGFYFLPKREEIIRTRLERYNFTNQKLKRVRRVMKLFKMVPWIKLVAVSNIIGVHNLKEESDIDLFIIASKNRIWLTRLVSAGFMALLNLRPRPGKERNKICLNFYLSEDELDLKSLRLSALDIYFTYWLAGLMPIYNREDTYKKLINANSWLLSVLPNLQTKKIVSTQKEFITERSLWYEIVDLFFGGLEKYAKKFQINKFPQSIKKNINKSTKIVISDQVIKLHVKDRREEYYNRWHDRIKEHGEQELSRQEILNIATI